MKHFGDITKINGAEVPMVDIITGGSPCQDLSVAGKRAGLKHSDKGDEETTRSGLFMEQIRIVKEMRDECARQLRMRRADDDFRLLKPRFMVWENVPGAFSSNKGEDFRCVLEEICRVADQSATIPMPEKGKWSTSGCIVGDGWSVAWRVHDAQFWGVPQRRKRIALVADFGSESAGKILFESESVSGDSEKIGETGEEAADNFGRNIDQTSRSFTFQERAGKPGGGKGILIQNDRTGALSTINNQYALDNKCLNSWDVQSKHIQNETIYSIGHDIRSAKFTSDEITDPLTATDYKDPIKINNNSVVRRLTPTECERLQGYPDGWTDIGDWVDSKGKKHKGDLDNPRYKALGNSIALPFWEWMAGNMANVLREDGNERPTMASLFDGIGGFPLVFSRNGVKPIWASEIEEFPIAVTKIHFSEED